MESLKITKTDLGMQVNVWGITVGTFDDQGVDCFDVAYAELLKELQKMYKHYSGLLSVI